MGVSARIRVDTAIKSGRFNQGWYGGAGLQQDDEGPAVQAKLGIEGLRPMSRRF